MFSFLPLIWRLVGIGSVVAILIGGVSYWSIHQYNKGYNAAIAAIAAKDREAVDAVNAAKSKVDECINRGGEWSTVDGLCISK